MQLRVFLTYTMLAVLAGCGGFQPIAPGSTRLPSAAVAPTISNAAGSSYLYVADDAFGKGRQSGAVDVFLRNDPAKGVVDRIVNGVFAPDGIFVDSHGTLYVTNGHMSGDQSVEAYKQGAHKPFRTYVGAACPFSVVAADDGTVYIGDACSGSSTDGRVLVYPPGKAKPSRSIYPGGPPYCLTLDAHGNLYVGYNADYTYWGQVQRFRPGAKRGVKLLPAETVFFLTDLAVDKHGALLVANMGYGVIDVFTGKDQPPSRIIKTGQGNPFRFSFDESESTIYVSYPCTPGSGSARPLTASGCGKRADTVVALDYATGRRLWTLRERIGPHVNWIPMGVSVFPKAPF